MRAQCSVHRPWPSYNVASPRHAGLDYEWKLGGPGILFATKAAHNITTLRNLVSPMRRHVTVKHERTSSAGPASVENTEVNTVDGSARLGVPRTFSAHIMAQRWVSHLHVKQLKGAYEYIQQASMD